MNRAIWLAGVMAMCGVAWAQTPADARAQARKLKADGNHAEAYQAYRSYLFTPGLDAAETARQPQRQGRLTRRGRSDDRQPAARGRRRRAHEAAATDNRVRWIGTCTTSRNSARRCVMVAPVISTVA